MKHGYGRGHGHKPQEVLDCLTDLFGYVIGSTIFRHHIWEVIRDDSAMDLPIYTLIEELFYCVVCNKLLSGRDGHYDHVYSFEVLEEGNVRFPLWKGSSVWMTTYDRHPPHLFILPHDKTDLVVVWSMLYGVHSTFRLQGGPFRASKLCTEHADLFRPIEFYLP